MQQLPNMVWSLWEALQVRMYTHSAKRLLGRMSWLLRRRAFLTEKMSEGSKYYVDGYGDFRTQVLEVDDLLQQGMEAIARLATVVGAKRLLRAEEPMQRFLEEARGIVEQARSQHDPPGIVDTPRR